MVYRDRNFVELCFYTYKTYKKRKNCVFHQRYTLHIFSDFWNGSRQRGKLVSEGSLNIAKFAFGNWLGACGVKEMTTNCTYSARRKCLELITKSKGSWILIYMYRCGYTCIYLYMYINMYTTSGILHGCLPGIITLLYTENVKMVRVWKRMCVHFAARSSRNGFLSGSLNSERFFYFSYKSSAL